MSAPEIFWPPKNSVPFLGCSNIDAMMSMTRICVYVFYAALAREAKGA